MNLNPLDEDYLTVYKGVGSYVQSFFPVYVVKCNRLSFFRELYKNTVTYQGYIDNNMLNLKKVLSFNHEYSLWDKLSEKIIPKFAMLTPDTEERYTQLILLPYELELKEYTCRINVEGESQGFAGAFEAVLSGLCQDNKYNVYSARNILLKKTLNVNTPISNKANTLIKNKKTIEEAEICLSIDVRKVGIPSERKLKDNISNCIKESLDKFEKKGKSKIVFTPEKLSPIEFRWKCFLATNAKDDKFKGYALEVYKMIVSLGLDPVHVVTAGQSSDALYNQVKKLLDCCPMLVAFYVPEKNNRYKIETKDGKYASSDWVIFEQSSMMALNRPTFILKHEDVRLPKFIPGRHYDFNDKTFSIELNNLKEAISNHLLSKEWKEDLNSVENHILKLDKFPEYGDLLKELQIFD